MSTKLKGLCLSAIVALAVSAFGVMNATADTGGHFTSEVDHVTIEGTETGEHQLHFVKEGGAAGERIGCTNDSYHGTISDPDTTVEAIEIFPEWSECETTSSTTKFDIHENGCRFVFTIGDTGTHHTAHLNCPVGEAVEITHPNCNITVPPQTVTGIVYTTDVLNGAHAITMDVTVKDIKTEYHEKICIFLGTNHESEMVGSVTVEGFDTDENPVDITATTVTP